MSTYIGDELSRYPTAEEFMKSSIYLGLPNSEKETLDFLLKEMGKN